MKTHRKILGNEDGVVIVVALMILALLTIIGVSGLRTSITETQISTNTLIHNMEFYAAESGAPHGVPWLLSLDLENDTDTEWFGPLDETDQPEWFELSNKCIYTWRVQHQTRVEDGIKKVLYYGDPDGDHEWTVQTDGGMPLETIHGEGTHPRGGQVLIETRWQFVPPFEIPNAALWVHDPDTVSFKGNATVSGDSADESVCVDAPDVLHTISPLNPIDEPAHYGDEFEHADSGGPYPFTNVKANLSKRADYIGSEFPTDLAEASTADNPVVIIIKGDLEINNADLKVPAHGVLFVDGNLRINGNVEWTGLVVSTGDTSIGNGTADILGALITGAAADVDISGTITIQHDCAALASLFDKYSSYRMTSWRQL